MRKSTGVLGIMILLSLLWHILGGGSLWWWLHARHQQQMVDLAEKMAQQSFQIVDLVQPANEIRPDRAKAIGKVNNATSKETVNAKLGKRGSYQELQRVKKIRQQQDAERKLENNQGMRASKKRSSLAPRTAIVKSPDGRFGNTIPEDYFPNYKRGAHTYINVMRHPDVGYFVEMKSSIRIAWNPIPGMHQTGLRPPVKCVVGIKINRNGTIGELFVLKSSGNHVYDREALRAFRVSAPFFPPPEKVLGIDGKKDDFLTMSWTLWVS